MWIPSDTAAQINSIVKRLKRIQSNTAEMDTVEGGAQLIPVFCTAKVPLAVRQNSPSHSSTTS